MTEKRKIQRMESLYAMRRRSQKTASFFKKRIEASEKYNKTLSKNAVNTVKNAASSLYGRALVPMTESGEPYLYRLSETVIKNAKEPITEAKLRAALQAVSEKHRFYDGELEYFKAFLILAAAESYIRTGEDSFVHAVISLEKINFNGIFEDFSYLETVFSREDFAAYRDSDRPTKNLYHARLRTLAKKKKEDELQLAEEIVARCNREKVPLHRYLPRQTGDGKRLFFYFLLVFTLLPLCFFATVVGKYAGFLIPFLLLPVYTFAKTVLEPFFAGRGERILPKLSKGEKLQHTGILVVTASFLYGEEKDDALFSKLEDTFLTNQKDNHIFGIVGDLPQSKRKKEKADDKIIAYADSRIRSLTAKYGDHFAMFIRGRRYSDSESAYIGWERKRGSVLQLCRFLRGGKDDFVYVYGNTEKIKDVKYLLTLDADTDLYQGAVSEMAGTMLHPENAPVFDEKKRIVVKGHGVLEPRVFPTLVSSEVSGFADLTSGGGGYDRYAAGGSDFYQTLFDAGIFCGKGMLDIDIFLKCCDGFFPENRILSHDLLEGNLTRAALATDIVLADGTPKNALSYYKRKHRWMRGDLQTVPYLFPTVKNEAGKKMKNPMTPLGKFKIADSVLSAATPLFSIIALLLSSFLGNTAFLYTLVFVFSSSLYGLIRSVFAVRYNGFPAIKRQMRLTVYQMMTLAAESFFFADALIRTVYRFAVSKKNFLNWQTAKLADDTSSHALDLYIVRFSSSMMTGLVFFMLPSLFARILGLLFILTPFYLYLLSGEKTKGKTPCYRDEKKLKTYVYDMLGFFDEYVDEKTNFLPPDNVQFFPTDSVAMRTSPTNIGLYLLAVISMRDMGTIDSHELYEKSMATAETVSSLSKWNGHLYNWYDIKTLQVLPSPFVSTVDSGNFITFTLAFCEGLREYVKEESKLLDVIKLLETVIEETDFSALYDGAENLFYIGYEAETGKYTDAHYDTFMSEALLTSYYAVASGAVPREHFYTLSRYVIGDSLSRGIASWGGTAFEYFMQSLLLPISPHSLIDGALHHAYREQVKRRVIGKLGGRLFRVFGISESGFFHFDGSMQYQYRPFGVQALSLNPDGYSENVVAPYATFLMMFLNPDEGTENLRQFEKLGMYGKYGFYEAVDFDSTRVGNGYAKIQSYMAHHVGMSIVAAVNLLRENCFQKRFMRNPKMRSCRELLLEKMPTVLIPYREKPKTEKKIRELAEEIREPQKKQYSHTVLYPQMAALSNTKTKVYASSSGHVEFLNGEDAVCVSNYDFYSLQNGFHAYAVIDGIPFPTVPLGKTPESYHSEFSFAERANEIEYRSIHDNGKWKYTVSLLLRVHPDFEAWDITCKIQGLYKEAYLLVYFEPILTGKQEYQNHKSFSCLFMESDYAEEENTVVWRRRPKEGEGLSRYLGVKMTPGLSHHFFETRKDDVLSPASGEHDFYELGKRKLFTDTVGPAILPAMTMRSDSVTAKEKKMTLTIAMAYDREELLYFMAKCHKGDEKERKIRERTLLHVQQGAAGVSLAPYDTENAVLRGMFFGHDRQERELSPLPQSLLWKYGVSGDIPLVLLSHATDSTLSIAAMKELLSIFKYMCIRGIRFDLVIFYEEKNAYAKSDYQKIHGEICRAGCENFISLSPGIYEIAENTLTREEKAAFSLYAVWNVDLTTNLEKQVTENPKIVSLSEGLIKLLLKEPEKTGEDIEKPSRKEVKTVHGGTFHEEGFLVKKPHGKAPFADILANENFGTVMTENSLGFTFSRNAALYKLSEHTADGMTEDEGEILLLRLYRETDETKYRDYDLCKTAKYADYGFDTVSYYGKCETVAYTVTVTLLGKQDIKAVFCTLHTDKKRKCALLYAVKPCMGQLRKPARFYVYQKEKKGVSVKEIGGETAVLSVGSPDMTDGYTDSAAMRSDGTVFSGRDDIACPVSRFHLYDKKKLSFYLAAFHSEEQARYSKQNLFTGKMPEKKKKETSVLLKTEFSLLDETVNKWCLHQIRASRLNGKTGFYQVSGAYGFRDQLQDCLAFLLTEPQIAKTMILRAAAHQYEEGDVQHFWHPGGAGLRSRCSDDYLWLIYVTAEYVKSTGEMKILDIPLPFLVSAPLDEREKDRYEKPEKTKNKYPLRDHLLRAYRHSDCFGEHGLPLMGTHDWNDGMNRVGYKGRGESVFLGFFYLLLYHNLEFLFSENIELLNEIQYKSEKLKKAISLYGYSENRYLRAYYDDGTKMGYPGAPECEIDALSEAFAGMASGILGFEKDRAVTALDTAYHLLFDREKKILKLLTPPFDKGEKNPGYIRGYVPGVRENGAQYTHAAIFLAIGFLLTGQYEKGAEILFSLCPAMRCEDDETAKIYRIEPYVLAGDVYTAKYAVGRGGWSFYTGSAAWFYRAVMEFLCGFRRTWGGFYIMPRLSNRFSSFTMTVQLQETFYQITATLGENRFTVLDGKETENRDFYPFDGGHHVLNLYMPKE